jgi:hypothetical protein
VDKLGFGNFDARQARLIESMLGSGKIWQQTPRASQLAVGDEFALDDHIPKVSAQKDNRKRPLANFATAEREREVLAEADAEATRRGEPGVLHDADAQRAADDILADKVAVAELLAKMDKNDPLRPHETLAAVALVNDELTKHVKDAAETEKWLGLRNRLRAGRTTQARSLRIVRDPLKGKTIHDATPAERHEFLKEKIAATVEGHRKDELDDAYEKDDTELIKKILDEQAKLLQKIERGLNKLGLGIETLAEHTKDAKDVSTIGGIIGATKHTWGDWLYEYWNQSILSGLHTQIINPVGSALQGAYRYGITMPLEAVFNAGGWDAEGVRLKDVVTTWRRAGPAIGPAFRNAITTWRTETPVTQGDKWNTGGVANFAIPGKLGRFVRAFGWRPLQVGDEFMNSMFSLMEVEGIAERLADKIGYQGKARDKFIADQMKDRYSPVWRLAKAKAAELTMQKTPEGLPTKLVEFGLHLKRGKILRWFFPFITFPVNSASTALRYAPVTGDIAAINKAYKNWKQGKPIGAGMSQRLAERFVAWGVMTAIAASIDPDDPWITGSKTPPSGYPKNSIRIGGKWYNYGRIEPFATTIGLAVDGLQSIKTGGANIGTPVEATMSQLSDKTFLRGLSDLFTLAGIGGSDATREEPEVRAARWSARFGESFIPNIWRQTADARRDHRTETRIWGRGSGEKISRAGRRFAEGVEAAPSQKLYGPWGRPVGESGPPIFSAPLTDFAWRLLSPLQTTDDQPTVGDQIIARWNARHPDDEVQFDKPMPYFTKNGQKYSLTDEEYAEFQEQSGQLADKLVTARFRVVESPSPKMIDNLKKVVAEARERVRARLLPKWMKRIREQTPLPPAQ